ncbi:hypothetical protein ATO2_15135 [Roseovarius sp. 22II1-1F6A]|nr:hypothetical protein ATO2_15135 [Roseovarius sp. 22II1-1F6A]
MTAMLDFFLPPEMSTFVFVVLLVISFVASFITVAFGIGGGALMLAVMATLVPPLALIPTHGVIQWGSNFGRMVLTWRHIFWRAVPGFLVGSIIGAGLGSLLVVNIPPALVQIAVACFILWSLLGKPFTAIRNWPVTVGAVSSFLTMFFGATGMFVATYTKSQALGRHAHVATHATLMTAQHGIKSVAFGIIGFAFGAWAPFIVAMIVLGFAGTVAGKLLLNRMPDARFRRALDLVLLLLSLRLLYGGVTQLIWG